MRDYVQISENGSVVRCYDEPDEVHASASLRLLNALMSLHQGNGYPVIMVLAGAVLGACDGIDLERLPFAEADLIKKFSQAADGLLDKAMEDNQKGENDFDPSDN